MDLEEFKELIFQNFINEAKNTLYAFEKSRSRNRGNSAIETSNIANSWGGHFARLPDSISFYNVEEFIEEYEEKLKNAKS